MHYHLIDETFLNLRENMCAEILIFNKTDNSKFQVTRTVCIFQKIILCTWDSRVRNSVPLIQPAFSCFLITLIQPIFFAPWNHEIIYLKSTHLNVVSGCTRGKLIFSSESRRLILGLLLSKRTLSPCATPSVCAFTEVARILYTGAFRGCWANHERCRWGARVTHPTSGHPSFFSRRSLTHALEMSVPPKKIPA